MRFAKGTLCESALSVRMLTRGVEVGRTDGKSALPDETSDDVSTGSNVCSRTCIQVTVLVVESLDW